YTVGPLYNTTYFVTIIDEAGSAAFDTVKIFVEFVPEIFFPNAFTPNGDNINDFFQAWGYNVTGYDLQIYNRWGELIYITNDISTIQNPKAGWDGTFNGDPAEMGSYVYQTTVVFNTGDTFTGSGSFLLVK
ncbi:MAG: gliding motility-associated C-terminal domain-containing protein, partial [Chitinophagales bacterium]|nr:gliding motility-associated C-terminal domain-containing protein [Chitinophagales bacterium]